MSERNCVELVAVYDDGTVRRWNGHDLQGDFHIGTPAGGLIDMPRPGSGDWEALRRVVVPTVTHPLRKVSRVRGKHFEDSETDCIVDRDKQVMGDGRYTSLVDLLPAGSGTGKTTNGTEGPLCDFVITVEAVPVKEGEP